MRLVLLFALQQLLLQVRSCALALEVQIRSIESRPSRDGSSARALTSASDATVPSMIPALISKLRFS